MPWEMGWIIVEIKGFGKHAPFGQKKVQKHATLGSWLKVDNKTFETKFHRNEL